jgi:hypothetical protein
MVAAVAGAQPGEMPGEVGRAHRGEILDPGRGERLRITIKIAAVRNQRVAGQPALDRQVVEVRADALLQGQLSTSPSGTVCMPCASATGP